MSSNEEIIKHSVHTLVFRSQKRTHDMFISDQGSLPAVDPIANKMWRSIKARSIYQHLVDRVDRLDSFIAFAFYCLHDYIFVEFIHKK